MYSIEEIKSWSKGAVVLVDRGTAPQKEYQDKNHFTEFLNKKKIYGASIDSRTTKSGELFFALRGEKIDGHEFVAGALRNGAGAVVVLQSWFELEVQKSEEEQVQRVPNGVYILVENVERALQDCAHEYRKTLQIPIVAVTGSNGKTTTKNMIQSVLQRKFQVCATKGNFNNHIGLPISILSIKDTDQIGVFEIGMNHPGEIAFLTRLLVPTHAVITGIGTAHIEFFKDTTCAGGPEEAIAHEKGELFKGVDQDGVCIFPETDKFASVLRVCAGQKKCRTVSCASKEGVALVEELALRQFVYRGVTHMLQNALLAIEVGAVFGIPSSKAIEALLSAHYEKGRFEYKTIETISRDGKHITMDIVDDTYNANPDSVCSLIRSVQTRGQSTGTHGAGSAHLVLGFLKEQGEFLNEGFTRIYNEAVHSNIKTIIFCGNEWKPVVESVLPNEARVNSTPVINVPITNVPVISVPVIHIAENHKATAELVKDVYQQGDIVLFKGSRSSKMEEVISLLSNICSTQGTVGVIK